MTCGEIGLDPRRREQRKPMIGMIRTTVQCTPTLTIAESQSYNKDPATVQQDVVRMYIDVIDRNNL
jgi:hypothetical protein